MTTPNGNIPNYDIMSCLHNEELHSLWAAGKDQYFLRNEDSPDSSPVTLTRSESKRLVETEGIFAVNYRVKKADFTDLGFSTIEAAKWIRELDYLADELSGGKPEKNRRLLHMERPQQLDHSISPSVPMTTDIELA